MAKFPARAVRMRDWTLQEKVAFLRDPHSYAHRPRQVQTVETHFAWVFLAGHFAYKLKKPVRQDALDYRTVAAREHGCREEIRLNRRLAPTVYLSVLPLTSRNGTLVLGRGGRIEDWLVKMRRLNLNNMLDRTLVARSLNGVELARLSGMLARFYARAKRAPMAPGRYLARLRRGIAANRRALLRAGPAVSPRLVKSVTRAQREFVAQAREALAARGSFIVEGHGDLRAEHVCLGSPACVIDCLEFSRDLRLLDPAEELAFLSLEVERLGRKRLAAQLVRRILAASDDHVAAAVVDFYHSYRALARAKLAIWHLRDPAYADPRPWVKRANSYLRDADRHLHRAFTRPRDPRVPLGSAGTANC
jgi:aminoglycoside phosphotransferase family enzyme